MQPLTTDSIITKARSLAVLLKIAPFGEPLDFKAESINELWAAGGTEDLLYELDQEGAIHFEAAGDDMLLCYTNRETPRFLQNYVEASIQSLQSATRSVKTELEASQGALTSIYRHNPTELQKKIRSSKEHIEKARHTIEQNALLRPLAGPLDDIQQHFDSLAVVAENYSSVYSNVLKPIEEEGRKGIRATVRWAIVGIAASVVVSNLGSIKSMFHAFAA
ncbi:hypothetical protein ABQ137_01050 [Xanthomonas sp. WHRI 8393]|uniref:hypothetical protein n=1 Tax=Xanthomonas sp. WHRI 8393 TaxID=3161574 RepID=UPI0032E8FDA6